MCAVHNIDCMYKLTYKHKIIGYTNYTDFVQCLIGCINIKSLATPRIKIIENNSYTVLFDWMHKRINIHQYN